MDLKGKVALITGAGSGIGAATAKRFIAEGARVCLNDINPSSLESVIALLPQGSALASAGDVTRIQDVERMVKTALSFSGKLDVLVNSAAIDPMPTGATLDLDLWNRVLTADLTGPFLTMKIALPHMAAAGRGSIINISSLAALRFVPGKTEYSAAKGGLIALTQQLAVEYGPLNIRCNVICPGGIRTPMLESHILPLARKLGKDLDWVLTQFMSNAPLRRIGQPEEVASICAFLASEDSSLITGGVLMADGGAAVVDVNGTAMKDIISKLNAGQVENMSAS